MARNKQASKPAGNRATAMPPSSSSSESLQRKNSQVPRRMGMRKWLEHLLDRNLCYGLEWKNKAKKIFSIVWKHASSHGFDRSKHADVFMQWARYKGNTVKEVRKKKKKSDDYHSTYKSNFRCALRSLIDCIEIGGGDEDSPKKFFQFISPNHPEFKVRRDKKRNSYCKKAKKKIPDSNFCEGQNLTDNTDVETKDIKDIFDFNEDENKTLLKTEFGNPSDGDQSTIENLPQLSRQGSQTLFSPAPAHEMETASFPPIILLPKAEQFKISFEETSEHPSSLPNFEALGVKDRYGPPTYMTSALLACGGDMKVKKEIDEAPTFQEPITLELLQPEGNVEESINTNQEQELSFIIQENLQETDVNTTQEIGVGNVMFIPNQASIENSSLQYTGDSGIITASTNILNNDDIQFTDDLGIDFLLDMDPPFCPDL